MNSTPPLEIEAKFKVRSGEELARLAMEPSLTPAYRAGDAKIVASVDLYVDTADFAFLRSGYALRLRRLGDETLVTLKQRHRHEPPAAIGDHRPDGPPAAIALTRIEVEERTPSATLTAVGELPDAVRAAIPVALDGDEPLSTLCVVRQRRTKRPLYPQRSPDLAPLKRLPAPLAEFSLDEVAVFANEEATDPLQVSYEVELELLPGHDAAQFMELVQTAAAHLQSEPVTESKFEAALQIVMGRRGKGALFTGNSEMAEACRAILRAQLAAMLLCEAGVRFSRDPEFVHDMRVATRRMRAAAIIYGDFFRKRALEKTLKSLRHTARLLGAVRDQDVAIERLERFVQKRSPGQESVFAAVVEDWRQLRTAQHKALLRWLDSAKYRRFVAAFARFCQRPGEGARKYAVVAGEAPPPHQVRHVAPSLILQHFEQVRAFEALFDEAAAGGAPVPVATLHALRIQCKYLRYNLEFMQGQLGEDGARLVTELKQLQQTLGDLNDAEVSRALMAALQAQTGIKSLGRYVRAQEKAIQKLSEEAPERFHRFVANANRRRLALALAHL